jgi:ParB family chromosome partitioning protein
MGKRKLGRGLDSLIGASGPASDRDPVRRSLPMDEPATDESTIDEVGGYSGTASADTPATLSPLASRERARAGPGSAPPRSESPWASPLPQLPGSPATPIEPAPAPAATEPGLLFVDVSSIDENPSQPRKEFPVEALETLRGSVRSDGVLQPLLVRRVGDRYQLIAGERRWRAAKEVGLETVPVRVVEVPDDRLLEVALIENVHRADLNPVELAEAYRRLLERKGWTQQQLAAQLSLSRSAVANVLRLLELGPEIQKALVRGQISTGHAKVLLSIDDVDARRALFDRIAEENLSVRDLEDARRAQERAETKGGEPDNSRPAARRKPDDKKPHVVSLENELSEALGTRVKIRERHGGAGSVTIEFYSREDFDRLRQTLIRPLP